MTQIRRSQLGTVANHHLRVSKFKLPWPKVLLLEVADADEDKSDTLTNQSADDDLQILLEDLEWDHLTTSVPETK